MAGGDYRILIHGDLDDTRILQKISAIQKKINTMTIGGEGGMMVPANGKPSQQAKGMSAYIKGTEKAVKTNKRFGQSTIDITKKVIQFGATTAVIRGVTSGMADMVNKTFELDGALTEFKKVSDLSGEGLEKYTEQAFKAGRSVAKTGTEMIQASTEFRKSGFNDQDSMKLGKVAMMFSNIADAELSAGDAAGFITSQIRADYKDISTEADKASMQIIDAINEVSNTQAVSSTDLSIAMSKVGSALQVNNNTYAESLGMVVAGAERMHGQASKVGRGIRTIGANISKLQKESKTFDLQTKDGIKTIDLWDKKTGQVKSTYEVFKEFAGVWDDMTPDQQQALSLEMAGKNQQEVFASVVGNWKNAEKAAQTATNQIENGGSAIKENAKYLDSMAGHLENLKSAWSEFSNSMVKSEGLKKGMDTLANFLRFLSSDAGHNLLGIAAGLTATYVAAKPLIGLFRKGKAIKDFMAFAGAFGKTGKKLKAGSNVYAGTAKKFTKMSDSFVVQTGRTTKATKKFKQASNVAAEAMNPLGLAVAAVGAAMAVNAVGIYKAYKETHKYREASDELTVSNQKSVKAIEDNAKRAEFLTETLDRLNGVENKTQGQKELLKQTVKELNELYPELNLKYDEEKDKINKTTDAIRDYIKAMQEEAKAAAYKENLEKSVKQQLKLEEKRKKAIDNLAEAQKQYDKEVQSGYVSQATSQRLAKAKSEFHDLQEAYIQTTKEVTKQSNNMVESSGAWDELVKKAKKAGTEIPESITQGIEDGTYAIPETIEQLESLISLDDVSQKIKETSLGKELAESLEQGLREGKVDIGQALEIEQEMSKVGSKMTKEGQKAVRELIDQFSSGEIDFSQFESGLEKISGDVKAIDKQTIKPKSVQVKADTASADKKLGETEGKAKDVGKQKPKIKVTADTAGAERKLNKLEGGSGKTTKKDVKVGANTSSATSALSTFKKSLTGVKDKTVKVTAKPVGISNVKSQINSLPKTKYIDVYVRKHGSVDTNASGTKHAIEGLSEVNERGWEFIRDAKTGKLRVAAGGERTVTYLNEGDIVYTHGESMRMVRQGETGDVVIPQHASGKNEKKKKKRQKAYDKEYSKLNKAHERAMKELEYKANTQHWNDEKLAQLELNQIKATNAKIKALNNKKKYKIKGLSKQKLIDTLDAEYKLKNAKFEVAHEAQTSAIEKAISGAVGTTSDLQAIEKKIKSSDKLSAEEKSKYLQEAYKNNVEYLQKMFKESRAVYDEFGRKHELTYDEMRKTLDNYYKEGMLTAKEYYDALDDLADEQLAKEKERLEKQQALNDNTYSLAKAYVQRQIEVLEKQNEEQETQNELIEKQNDLEKARNKRVRVYREGQGFVYEQDTEAIREATQALEDFKKTEESPELKQWRSIMELFDDLEALAEIKDLENKVGATAQGLFGGLGTDLGAWTKFVKENLATSMGYDNLLEAMGDLVGYEAIFDWLKGSGETVSAGQIADAIAKNRFASGSLYTPAGFARVGEQGYEIALLGKGDAVMPHNVSRNLMEWGQMSPLEYAGANSGDSYMYQFDKLVLPNVQNANDFMRELKNLPNKALQFSGSRA